MPGATQDLVYNVTGQSIVFDAPYRPTSVTSVTVLPYDAGDDDTAETATTGSASIDSVNTTFDAASGFAQSNPRRCNLTATTNIVKGRQYLATGSAQRNEWVEVMTITSGVSIQGRAGLLNNYVSGNAFQGTRISISVLDAFIQDDQKISGSTNPNPGYRVAWVWVGTPPGGVAITTRSYTYFDVVRSPGVQHGVTPADMERFVPGWTAMLPTSAQTDQGRQIIAQAYDDVKFRLHQAMVPDQQIRNREVLHFLVQHAARMMLQRHKWDAGGPSEPYLESKEEYTALIRGFFTTTARTDVATGSGSGASRNTSPIGIWSR